MIEHIAQLVVIGAGPGGYTAAFRAADLGMDVILVERWDALGGVCLNVGCIPSKALLHAAKVIDDAAAMAEHGVVFGKPRINALKLRGWKNDVVGKLTGGLEQLARQRKVRVVHGVAKFESARTLRVNDDEMITFEQSSTALAASPIANAFFMLVVVASVGHSPSMRTKIGLPLMMPFVSSLM